MTRFKFTTIFLLAANAAVAESYPAERICNASMDTMFEYRSAVQKGVSVVKLIESAKRPIRGGTSVKESEFQSSLWLWAIKSADLEDNEFRSNGLKHCFREYIHFEM